MNTGSSIESCSHADSYTNLLHNFVSRKNIVAKVFSVLQSSIPVILIFNNVHFSIGLQNKSSCKFSLLKLHSLHTLLMLACRSKHYRMRSATTYRGESQSTTIKGYYIWIVTYRTYTPTLWLNLVYNQISDVHAFPDRQLEIIATLISMLSCPCQPMNFVEPFNRESVLKCHR